MISKLFYFLSFVRHFFRLVKFGRFKSKTDIIIPYIPIFLFLASKAPPPTKAPLVTCKAKVDVGFVLDSSGSIRNDYQNEKDFLKSVAAVFGVSKNESRAGVITFSHNVEHSIKLKDHTDLTTFSAAVDAIPLMGSVTRIDKALRLTQKELFTTENGARAGLPKILLLLTDGSQTPSADAEDPATIAEELRKSGITLLVVGMGSGVNPTELAKIAGGDDKAFSAATFNDLLSDDFMKSVQDKACSGSY